MTGVQKVNHLNWQDVIEPEFRGLSKVRTPSPDKRRRSPKQHAEDNTSVVSDVVGRVCEGSVASDVSGLTDGEFLKTDDFSSPPATASKKNRNSRSPKRAPEPPGVPVAGTLRPSTSADFQSETTETTVSSARDEKLARSKKKSSVSFCNVQVRNYERSLEVNPSVTSGPAIGIGWKYIPDDDEIFSVEVFEESREYSRCGSINQLALPRDKREDLLRSWGYSQKEIAWSVRTILRSKNQRKQTVQNLNASAMEEFMETFKRKMKYVFMYPCYKRKKAMQVYDNVCPPQGHSNTKNFESSVLRKPSLIQPSAAA